MPPKIKQLAQAAGLYVEVNGQPWPRWLSAEECERAYAEFAALIVAHAREQGLDELEG